MLSYDSLKEIFSKDPKKYYEVEFFQQEGFERRKCPICKKHFWSTGKESCGDSSCEPYSFFKEGGNVDYIETWKRFERFFKDSGHTSIPRYPVICRWREDLYFTIASIVDFMRLEHGVVHFEYPANPLIVPQTCLRFNDIPSVGVTGRHMTSFIMGGQHAFGSEGYWKDRCLDLNFHYLTDVLGVPKDQLTYIEDVWAMPDLSSFGPCMESFAGGLELANSVFMQYRKSGENDFKELDLRVIDVGWGFDRLAWYSAGTPTVYDVAYGPVVGKLIDSAGIRYDRGVFADYAKLSGKLGDGYHSSIGLDYTMENLAKDMGMPLHEIEKSVMPMQGLYAVTDHARTLLFAVADGGIPSNVGGGFNLRVILRRALAHIRKNNFNFSLVDVAEEHAKYLRPMFPELAESMDEFGDIVAVEEKRYASTSDRARRIVAEAVTKSPIIPKEKYVLFYESYGITPEFVKEVAMELGTNIEVPSGIYEELTDKHVFGKIEEEKPIEVPPLPPTVALYYQDYRTEGKGRVLYVKDNMVILDETPFYPEGGGQVADTGVMRMGEEEYVVKDAQKVGGVIIHILDREPALREGDIVECSVDKERRMQLRQHHTATHIIAAAARAVLGNHVWQAGAHKSPEKAHLDITHFERLTQDQLESIERIANDIVSRNIPVVMTEMSRGEAEAKYGFSLYQGGPPPGKIVRVLQIPGVDYELCAGTHLDSTGQAGVIKIIKEERIQDGINRLEYVAGKAALEYIEKQDRLLTQIASTLSISKDGTPQAVEKFFKEWKEKDKIIEKLVELYAGSLPEKEEIEQFITLPADILRTMAIRLSGRLANSFILFYNSENFVVCAAGKNSKHDAAAMIKKLTEKYGGNGGGSKTIATAKLERSPR